MGILRPPFQSLNANFKPPWWGKNPHVQTLYRYKLGALRHEITTFKREFYDSQDGDQVVLDWAKAGHSQLAIILPGLEGSSRSGYITGLVRHLFSINLDLLVLNHRGCAGLPNNSLRSYHSGFTTDLRELLLKPDLLKPYSKLYLIGFSVGGNITLKYLGEQENQIPEKLAGAIAISVPCDLSDSANQLRQGISQIYQRHLVNSLINKLKEKRSRYPEITNQSLTDITTFEEFDDRFTAPFFEYRDAKEYWENNSSKRFIPKIKIPTIILSAKDDPFYSRMSIPVEESKSNQNISLIVTEYGGHVGFVQAATKMTFYEELIQASIECFKQ